MKRSLLTLGLCCLWAFSCSSESKQPIVIVDATPADSISADSLTDGSSDVATVTCGPALSIDTYQRGSLAEVSFPKGFLWGAASAGFQIEKGLVNSDWYQWAKLPGKVKGNESPDNGPDAFANLDVDVKALKDAGATAYRFSIEWARIYPTKTAFDNNQPNQDGLKAYHDLLSKLRTAGIRPFVTLHHFVTPDYLDDVSKPSEPQSFERTEMPTMFGEWAKRMAKEFGAEVDDWVTINEPLVLLIGAYLAAGHPPGLTLQTDRLVKAARGLVATHIAAYDAIHANDTVDAGTGAKARVGVAKHNRVFFPDDACVEQDIKVAKHVDYLWNEWLYNAVVLGDWDDELDGKMDGPKDRKADPAYKGKVDFIGVNYYGNATVTSSLPLPLIGGFPNYANLPSKLPKTDLLWDIYPQGFRAVLKQLKKYNLPVYILENGIADSSDNNRSRFLAEHAFEMGKAIQEDGVDVRGYFHWSLTDNFEWGEGFCPRFGLYRVDYSSSTKTRTPTKAVALFKNLAAEQKLKATTIDALPAYQAPVVCK